MKKFISALLGLYFLVSFEPLFADVYVEPNRQIQLCESSKCNKTLDASHRSSGTTLKLKFLNANATASVKVQCPGAGHSNTYTLKCPSGRANQCVEFSWACNGSYLQSVISVYNAGCSSPRGLLITSVDLLAPPRNSIVIFAGRGPIFMPKDTDQFLKDMVLDPDVSFMKFKDPGVDNKTLDQLIKAKNWTTLQGFIVKEYVRLNKTGKLSGNLKQFKGFAENMGFMIPATDRSGVLNSKLTELFNKTKKN